MGLEISYVIGPLLAAVVFNAFLFGICTMQFVSYITSGFKDRLAIRFIIYWSILLDTFHTLSVTWMLWFYVVRDYNNSATLAVTPWPFPSIPIVTACTSVPIQHFLAWRIKNFTSSTKIFAFLSLLSLTQGAFAIASGSLALLESNITSFYQIIPPIDVWNGVAIICDVTTTYLLAKHLRRSSTESRSATENVITKIIIQSIETAAFPMIFCIMDFITFTLFQNTTFHLIFAIPMGRIYTNTLLLTLNSRTQIRKDLGSGMRGTNLQLPTLTVMHSAHEVEDRTEPENMNILQPEIAVIKSTHREFLPSGLTSRAPSRMQGTS